MKPKHTARLLATAVATATLALTTSATTTATATPAPTLAAKRLNLSNKHNRQSFTVHKGDEITVHLTGEQTPTSTWGWTSPTAANTAVLRRDAVGSSSNGEATAVFHARDTGTTTLDSHLRCTPRKPGQNCSDVVVPWQVTVKVR
ncbi:hypothetical protein [Streptomyces caatingaensis]|uniref:Proteinase inhibitor I42 chagasin domain-containing protein n=1 Tax=Streptomyces caatingaensis TaxID=1678637 RepID=A0A0K9XFB3_9ACTN|nr:hypothetical protein [Streptomyces caatingaensis]KNB52114.1 hypothetical protein AC230_13220 [Streptomyces caatingaensis]